MIQRKPKLMADTDQTKAAMETIGARIASLRLAAGMDQEQLGDRLGLGPDAISSMEKGKNLVHYIKTIRLALALRATPNQILGFSMPESPATPSPDEREAFRILLERSYSALGLPLEQAHELSRSVLEVLDSPVIRNKGKSPENIADTLRVLVDDAVLRFLQSNPR